MLLEYDNDKAQLPSTLPKCSKNGCHFYCKISLLLRGGEVLFKIKPVEILHIPKRDSLQYKYINVVPRPPPQLADMMLTSFCNGLQRPSGIKCYPTPLLKLCAIPLLTRATTYMTTLFFYNAHGTIQLLSINFLRLTPNYVN